MRAASPSSTGALRKNCRNRNAPSADARLGTIRPWYVSIQPRSPSSCTTGTSTTVNGIINPLSTITNSVRLSGKSNIAKA